MPREDEASLYAYHVLTHTTMLQMRRKPTGPAARDVENELIAHIAGEYCRKVVGDGKVPLLKMLRILHSNGFRVHVATAQRSIDIAVSCPFSSIHAEIPHDTICPIALLLLASMRLSKFKLADATLNQNLTPNGVECTMLRLPLSKLYGRLRKPAPTAERPVVPMELEAEAVQALSRA